MSKKVRKGVRTFLIENNKVIITKYKTEKNKDFYDIPGGKIEENETSREASCREFKEETGIEILNQSYKGHVIIEYPEMIFDFDVYLVDEYHGVPLNFIENDSMWMDIKELLKEEKRFPCIEIIKYLEQDRVELMITSDKNHSVIKIEENHSKDNS